MGCVHTNIFSLSSTRRAEQLTDDYTNTSNVSVAIFPSELLHSHRQHTLISVCNSMLVFQHVSCTKAGRSH